MMICNNKIPIFNLEILVKNNNSLQKFKKKIMEIYHINRKITSFKQLQKNKIINQLLIIFL